MAYFPWGMHKQHTYFAGINAEVLFKLIIMLGGSYAKLTEVKFSFYIATLTLEKRQWRVGQKKCDWRRNSSKLGLGLDSVISVKITSFFSFLLIYSTNAQDVSQFFQTVFGKYALEEASGQLHGIQYRTIFVS